MTKPGDEIPSRCLGETGALSFKKPTEQDLKDTQELETTLSHLSIFETPEEMSQRREALVRLQEISNDWIRRKALEQNLPAHVVNATTGKIFTFGSYRLGVNFRGADIDSLLVVPRFITRDEFFEEFQAVLSESSDVEDIHAVVDAYVPVLKMKFMGVEIDLLFAQVDQMTILDNFSLCENTELLMRNMDERDVRSINGVRVTEDILNLVYNKNSFKIALKVIRIWAKRRNIYSNALGFLGGVSWAILVSRICQLYPYATPSMIVYLFFKIFSQWPWPKPVRLRESEYISSLCLPVWDPRLNPMDQYHLMPILTPSYPSQNSTYNVQRSNRIIIERELKLGLSIVRDSLMHKLPWSTLFEPAFFFHYRHYVVVIVTGSTKRSFVELCGLVESKLRVLVSNFELNRYVKIAHVNCHAFGKGPSDGDAELVRKWFIGMEFDRNPNSLTNLTTMNNNSTAEKPTLNVDLSENISSFEKSIERGLSNDDPSNMVTVKYVKKSQLCHFVSADDMEEIKRQAAASVISPINSLSDQNKSAHSAAQVDHIHPMSSPSSHSDSGSSPAGLHRSGSSASVIELKLNSSTPEPHSSSPISESRPPDESDSRLPDGTSSSRQNSIKPPLTDEQGKDSSDSASPASLSPRQSSKHKISHFANGSQNSVDPLERLQTSVKTGLSVDDVKRARMSPKGQQGVVDSASMR
ncbi:unnamed protein product [Calicophoron daubneyi]|uniref:polynucleotide adenylyltransferase n=1 Tax=Calicophoron daubneyi TaxID=300641 RepID=A0AAV2TBF0_CALDB